MAYHGDYDGGGEQAIEINDEIIAAASYSAEDEAAVQRLPDATNSYDDDDDAATVDYGNNSPVDIPTSSSILSDDDDDGAAGGTRARMISKKKKYIMSLVSIAFLAMVIGFGAGFGTKAKNKNSLSSSNEALGMTYEKCMKDQGLPIDEGEEEYDEVEVQEETTEPTTESPTSFPTEGASAGSSASEALSQAGMDTESNDNNELITVEENNNNNDTGGRGRRRELRGNNSGGIAASSAKRRELKELPCAQFLNSKSSKMTKSNKAAKSDIIPETVTTTTPAPPTEDPTGGTTTTIAKSDCIIQVAKYLPDPDYFPSLINDQIIDPNTGQEITDFPDESYDCMLDPTDADGYSGTIRQLGLTEAQNAEMAQLVNTGAVKAGKTKLKLSSIPPEGGDNFSGGGIDGIIEGGVEMSESEIKLPPTLSLADAIDTPEEESIEELTMADFMFLEEEEQEKKKPVLPETLLENQEEPLRGRGRKLDGMTAENSNNGRRLQNVVTKKMLVVKVIDKDGLQRPESPMVMGDDFFGTEGDPVNLKERIEACSMGKWKVKAGHFNHESKYDKKVNGVIVKGVMTVRISVSLSKDKYTIHNAVTKAVEDKLGTGLPGPYNHVMYVLQKCYNSCGWAAYAYINSWMSVYQNDHYKKVGVQFHELGHNFGLAHSGGTNGQTYTDHTGSMGNPYYKDDEGIMCWNAAKSWQIGWYNDGRVELNPLDLPTGSAFYNLVGIADYKSSALPVLLKLNTNSQQDYYINFNRKSGVNSEVKDGGNRITIVKTGGEGNSYSQSYLQAHIGEGEQYTISNFDNKDIVIKFIGIEKNPLWMASIQVYVVGAVLWPDTCTNEGNVPLEVAVTTDSYPAETSWELKYACSNQLVNRLKYEKNNAFVDRLCVPQGRYTFIIKDSYGDGLCCEYGEGGYSVKYDGDIVVSAFENAAKFGESDETDFGPSCPTPGFTKSPTPSPTKRPTPSPTKRPTPSPTKRPTPGPSKSPTPIPTKIPTPIPTRSPTPIPTKSPTPIPTKNPTPIPTKSPTPIPTKNPTKNPTPSPTGPTKSPTPIPTKSPTPSPTKNPTPSPTLCVPIVMNVTTDDYPQETSWKLQNNCTGIVVAIRPSYTDGAKSHIDNYCFPPSKYIFIINDSYGDGLCCGWGRGLFSIKYNGQTVVSRSEEGVGKPAFESELRVEFGQKECS